MPVETLVRQPAAGEAPAPADSVSAGPGGGAAGHQVDRPLRPRGAPPAGDAGLDHGGAAPLNEFSRPGTPLEEVNGIVIHYVGNPGTTAAQNHSFFTNLAQTGRPTPPATSWWGWTERCSRTSRSTRWPTAPTSATTTRSPSSAATRTTAGEFTSATYESLVRLTRWLMEEYGLDTSQVIRHYDVTGSSAPRPLWSAPRRGSSSSGGLEGIVLFIGQCISYTVLTTRQKGALTNELRDSLCTWACGGFTTRWAASGSPPTPSGRRWRSWSRTPPHRDKTTGAPGYAAPAHMRELFQSGI